MESYKGLKEQFSRQELVSIFQKFTDKIVLYRSEDENGTIVALRGCMILDRFGWDLFAATNVIGRNLYASYVLLWEILKHCQRAGVKNYDLMGVDPVKNSGVYNFKKGTGASSVKYLGEWDWESVQGLRWGANTMLRFVRSIT